MDGSDVPRGNFIPFRLADVVRLCLARDGLDEEQKQLFRRLCLLLTRYYHSHFHIKLSAMKECYAPFNPDTDTLPIEPCSPGEAAEKHAQLVDVLSSVATAANFDVVKQADLDRASAEESLFNVRLTVDFEEFEKILFYRRGESLRKGEIKSWFGLHTREIEFTNYDRVLIYVQFKGEEHFRGRNIEELSFQPGSTMIKLFRNIPRADLEMLFPNTKVAMRVRDKMAIGVPEAMGGFVELATKLVTTVVLLATLGAFLLDLRVQPVLLALGVGICVMGLYIWNRFDSFKRRKTRFMKELADNLYFRNLDNNAGVFHHLIDAAEEAECKEALLAYYYLVSTDEGITENELDAAIEQGLGEYGGHRVDFEIDDALRKIEQLGLVRRVGEKIQALPMEQAIKQMEHRCQAQLLDNDAAENW